jgi:hypothetical protein
MLNEGIAHKTGHRFCAYAMLQAIVIDHLSAFKWMPFECGMIEPCEKRFQFFFCNDPVVSTWPGAGVAGACTTFGAVDSGAVHTT